MRDCACGSRCTTCAAIVVPETDVFGSYESAASTTLFAGPYFDLDGSTLQPVDATVCGSKWPDLVTFTLAQQQIYGGTKVWSDAAGQYIRQYKMTNYDFNPNTFPPGGIVIVDPDSVDFAFELEYKRGLGLWQAQLTEFFGVECPKTLVVEAYPISTIPSWAEFGETRNGYTCMRYYAIEDGKRITPFFGTRCTGLIGISLPNPAGVMLSTIYSDFTGSITGSMAPYQDDLPSFFFNIPLS